MPLWPFPLPICVGTDICHVVRIHRLICSPITSPRSSLPDDKNGNRNGHGGAIRECCREQNDADGTGRRRSGSSNEDMPRLEHFLKRFLRHSEQRAFWRRFPEVHQSSSRSLSQTTSSSERSSFPSSWSSPPSPSSPPPSSSSSPSQSSVSNESRARYSLAVARYLAGRWAAKEAVIKAVSASRRISFLDVEIRVRADHAVRHRQCSSSRIYTGNDGGENKDGEIDADKDTGSEPTGSNGVYGIIWDRPKNASRSRSGRFQVQNDGIEGAQDDSYSQNDNCTQHGVDGRSDEHCQHDEENEEEGEGHMTQISISHDGEYAVATCLAPVLPREGDVGGEAAAREP